LVVKKFLSQLAHIVADLLLRHLGVYLRCLNTLMPEHLADGFNGDIVLEGDRRSEGMSGGVGRQVLVDPA